MNQVGDTLYETAAILKALSALLQQQSNHADYSAGELLGLGYLLQLLAQDLGELEERLRSEPP